MNQQDPSRHREIQFHVQAKIGSGSGPLAKFVAGTLAVAALVAGLFLSVFVFAGLLITGVVAGGWIWWRTRGLRRQLKASLQAAEAQVEAARAAAGARAAGAPGVSPDPARSRADDQTIIEGDYIRPKGEPPIR